MTTYQLLPNEVVLLNEETAFRGMSSPCELMLTNLNLVVTHRNVFGKPKSCDVFPVRQIKTHNGQAQALLSTKRNVPILVVYFMHGEESFRFGTGTASKLEAWAAKINEAVTGQPAPPPVPQRASGVVGSALGIAKETLGLFKAPTQPQAPTRAAGKCGSCGAPISGVRGQATACEYCDTVQQL